MHEDYDDNDNEDEYNLFNKSENKSENPSKNDLPGPRMRKLISDMYNQYCKLVLGFDAPLTGFKVYMNNDDVRNLVRLGRIVETSSLYFLRMRMVPWFPENYLPKSYGPMTVGIQVVPDLVYDPGEFEFERLPPPKDKPW